MIDNGSRVRLVIAGVFDGIAGRQGNKLAFLPNRAGSRPSAVKGGIMDGVPVRLVTTKDAEGPFWTSRFEVIS
jgi:hypothetical protein